MRSCHDGGIQVPIPDGARKIVLAGNPNAGKSVFFNFLTGLYVDVSNYPGTTLEISSGRFGNDVVMDTPGVYGLSSFNDEERIARDIILQADLVINIVDAVHLDRDLFLTQQIIDTGIPVIVALNMMDEVKQRGLTVDAAKLAGMLGVPVIPTVAVRKEGLATLRSQLDRATVGRPTPGIEAYWLGNQDFPGNQGEKLLLLEGDPVIAERFQWTPGEHRETIYQLRREWVNQITQTVFGATTGSHRMSERVGGWMLHPVAGWPILAAVLWGMYQFIGVFVAGTVVGFTEEVVMAGQYEPWIRALFGHFVSPGSLPGLVLTGEFGLVTMTVTYLVGLLLPLVVGFYLCLSVLEDSGYLPRVATLVDRAMNALGLNGRAVIPIILGFGCVTVATITTRLLGSEREKRIAIFLLGLAIPCSAQLGVISGLLAKVGAGYVLLYGLVLLAILVLTGTLLKTVIPGRTTDLMIDLPTIRLPRVENVLKKTAVKSGGFIVEAAPLFALGSLIISVLQITGALELFQTALGPLTKGWLGLPPQTAAAFIMGIVRRDFGAAGLSSIPMTPLQTVVSLLTITLFVPCIASVMIMFKERSKKEAAVMWVSTWVIAFLVGGIVNQLGGLFHGNVMAVAGAFLCGTVALILAAKVYERKRAGGERAAL